jgi:hypothetical protein
MRLHAFWLLSQIRPFQNSWGFEVDGEEVVQRNACESEFYRWGSCKGMMGNILRNSESSWLGMKFECAFIACHGILIRASDFFLALPVNEFCLLFLSNPDATSCFVLHSV